VSAEISTHESGDGGSGGGGGDEGATAIDVLKKGDTLGRYLVLEQLGAGAMGVVYAAYDPELDRKIAIKILRPQEGKGDKTRRQERLVREAKAMAKLSHPNVGAIYDVGVHGDQVFLAMEFLSGGTLRAWMAAKKRPWREVVKMFIEVGKGLAGAHAEGLIHRDFKPDNVLLDKNGAPKVVDFGLVRLNSAALDRSTTGSIDAISDDEAVALPLAHTALAPNLTRTGALTGTPAYMAPEQFLGKDIDARTDQFAFCVALYEALYGERPFAGETLIAIADSVTDGRVRTSPSNASIPPWVRRVVVTGLHTKPADRYPSVEALVAALLDDPEVRRRNRLRAAGVFLAIVAVLGGTRYWFGRKQRELDRHIAEKVRSAEQALAELPSLSARYTEQRQKALHLYDSGNPRAEAEWQQALAAWSKVDVLATSAFAALDAARSMRPSTEIDAQLTRALIEHARRNEYAERFDIASAILARAVQTGVAGSPGTATVNFSANAYPATVAIFRYDRSAQGRFKQVPITTITTDRSVTQVLPRGSYLVRFSAPSKAATDYPLFVRMGESIALSAALPPEGTIPRGFVYVPAGRFLSGDLDETLRTGFTNGAPLHERSTKGFLVSDHELTFAEWLAFLRSIPSRESATLVPRASEKVFQFLAGSVEMRTTSNGAYRLKLAPVMTPYSANEGDDIVYSGRSAGARQNWLKMPVVGVSAPDVQKYAAWLDRTGRLPGARLCTEDEWERAARGADDRRFPHGNELGANDANHDLTYGRVATAFGPDEVGSHPASRSPFGLDDMAGNVWEIVSSRLGQGAFVLRSGGYYHFENTELVTNREPVTSNVRSAHVGTRICAEPPKGVDPSRITVQPL
jgi:formylglycine-generating enzyme required for sulfatase activity